MVYNFESGVRQDRSKKLVLIAAAVITSIAVTVSAFATSFAAGNAQSGSTVGNCMSDGLYGNEPNMANGAPGGPAEQEPGTKGGNVVPTQSPGPFVNNSNDPDNPVRGKSAGQWNQLGVNIPEICRTLTN